MLQRIFPTLLILLLRSLRRQHMARRDVGPRCSTIWATTTMPSRRTQKEAQRYFDEGLILAYGFNHKEAIRSFAEAARLDPDAAMPHWGIALAYGPNIKTPMPDEAVPKAYAALQQAQKLALGASPREQAHIRALAKRYSAEPVRDRSHLDQAYAAALCPIATLMTSVWYVSVGDSLRLRGDGVTTGRSALPGELTSICRIRVEV